MLNVTLLYGYNCSYAVLQRVQCKEYNLQFMLLCNSCIYFAHAIKNVWYIVIFSSTIRLFSAGLLSVIIWWRRLRTMKYGMKVTTGETLQDFSPTSRFITCLFGCTTTQQGTLFFQMNAVPSLELTLPTKGKGSSLGIDCTCCSSTEVFKKWPMTKALLCLIGNGLKIKKPAQFVLKSILASPMWPQAASNRKIFYVLECHLHRRANPRHDSDVQLFWWKIMAGAFEFQRKKRSRR